MNNKSSILDSKLVVIKVGSSLLFNNDSFNHTWLDSFAKEVKYLREKKVKVLLVASGAVSFGKKYLTIKDSKILKINEKQACASCGQSILMQNFIKSFKKQKIKVSQILLTFSEIENRKKNLNIRETINSLLEYDVIPVINENDSVATDELKFGDNDRLAAIVAQISDANILILLSDVKGLYEKNPFKNKNVKFISKVSEINKKIQKMASSNTNLHGSGGMATKIEAARIAMNFGCNTIICSGKIKDPIKRIINKGNENGTWFISKKKKLSHFKRWLASSFKVFGELIIDEGAVLAIKDGSSLLPSGILKILGKFSRGDIVEIKSENKILIGRGVISYDSEEIKKIQGKKTSEIFKVLGYSGRDEIIHRDNFILDDKIK
tara:strand:- start:1261 stop:2397 length:1137 start_codon:yes stop_codon:yes gene_type:complete